MIICPQNIDFSGLAGLLSSPNVSSGSTDTSDFAALIMSMLGGDTNPDINIYPVLTEPEEISGISTELISGIDSTQTIEAKCVISTKDGKKIIIPVMLLNAENIEFSNMIYDAIIESVNSQSENTDTQIAASDSGIEKDTENAPMFARPLQTSYVPNNDNVNFGNVNITGDSLTEKASAVVDKAVSEQPTVSTEKLSGTNEPGETETVTDTETLSDNSAEEIVKSHTSFKTDEFTGLPQTEIAGQNKENITIPDNKESQIQHIETEDIQVPVDSVIEKSDSIIRNFRFSEISDESVLSNTTGDEQSTQVTLKIIGASDDNTSTDQIFYVQNKTDNMSTEQKRINIMINGLLQETTQQPLSIIRISTSSGEIPIILNLPDSSGQNISAADLINDLITAGADVELVLDTIRTSVNTEILPVGRNTDADGNVQLFENNGFSTKTNRTIFIIPDAINHDTVQTSGFQPNTGIIRNISDTQEIRNTDTENTGQQIQHNEQKVSDQNGLIVSAGKTSYSEEQVDEEILHIEKVTPDVNVDNVSQNRQSGGVGAGSNPTDEQRTFTRTPVKPPDAVIKAPESIPISVAGETETLTVENTTSEVQYATVVSANQPEKPLSVSTIADDSTREILVKENISIKISSTIIPETFQKSTATFSKIDSIEKNMDSDIIPDKSTGEEISVTGKNDMPVTDATPTFEMSGKVTGTVVSRFIRTGSEHKFLESGEEIKVNEQIQTSPASSVVSSGSIEKNADFNTTMEVKNIETETLQVKHNGDTSVQQGNQKIQWNESVSSESFVRPNDSEVKSGYEKPVVSKATDGENVRPVFTERQSETDAKISVDKPTDSIKKTAHPSFTVNTDIPEYTEKSEQTEQHDTNTFTTVKDSVKSGISDIAGTDPSPGNTINITGNDSEDSGITSHQKDMKTEGDKDATIQSKTFNDAPSESEEINPEPAKKNDSQVKAAHITEQRKHDMSSSRPEKITVVSDNKSGTVNAVTRSVESTSDSDLPVNSFSVYKTTEQITVAPDVDATLKYAEGKSHRMYSETDSSGKPLVVNNIEGDIGKGRHRYGSSESELMSDQNRQFGASGYAGENKVGDIEDFSAVQSKLFSDYGESDSDRYALNVGQSDSVLKVDTQFGGRGIFQNNDAGTIHDIKNEVLNTIVKNAKFMFNSGQSSAVINLEPPSLGKLKLEIISDNFRITGKITVESNETKEIIQSKLIELKEQLTQSGLKVESFDVQLGHNSGTDSWANREKIENLTQNLRRNIRENEKIESEYISGIQSVGRGKSMDSGYLDILM